MAGYQEEQVESVPVRRCITCGGSLSIYNKGNECFRHSGRRVRAADGEGEIAAAAVPTDPHDSRAAVDIALAAALRIGGESARMEVAAILDAVADDFKVPLGDILDRYGSRRAIAARHVAVYLAWKRLSWHPSYVGEVTCQSKANAKFACKKIRNLIAKDAEMAGVVSRIQAELDQKPRSGRAGRRKNDNSARKE